MKQSLFENQHQADWQAFSTQLDALERGKADSQQCKALPQPTGACASTWRWHRVAATAAY